VTDINNQSAQRQSSSSVIGGFEAGYNLQLGYFVMGGETDISLYRLHGSSFASAPFTGFPVPAGGTAPSYFNDVNSSWLFTARGRLGLTPMTNLLVYGTGGVAVTCATRPNLTRAFSPEPPWAPKHLPLRGT